MGETKWTKEQLSAIETRKCNLLIAAAAGSGKTAVLVERIIRIITNEANPVDIDKLLVVTFTSAAAAEMRERIAEAITEALEANPNSKNLQKQLTLLGRANITTMHSFCLDIIKNNFSVIDLDPSFRILDETEGVLLKSETLEDLFEDKYDESDEMFLNLVDAYSGSKDDEKLKEIILDLYRFSMSGPWPEKWLIDKSEEFNINTLEELNNSVWVKVLKDNIRIEVEGLISMEHKAIELCNETDGLEPYIENFNYDIDSLTNILFNTENSIEEIYLSLNSISFTKLKTVKKNNVSDLNIQETVKGIRDDVKKKITKLREDVFSMDPSSMLESIKEAYPYVKKLTDLVIEFNHSFSKAKKEKGVIDFNDLEHFCLKILTSEKSNVSNNLKEYFDEVLIDEYQDSNNVQEAIIDLVSRKNTDDPNVFMVGDVKQSIYRFRQAKPELFLSKYNTYSKDEGKNRKIQLFKNFRSREEVINGVNFIFKEVMSDTVGELKYSNEESLNLGASFQKVENDKYIVGGDVELHVIDKSYEEKESIHEEEDIDAITLEARLVAKRINELMATDKNGSRFMVFDKVTKEYRRVKYKDIVILLRATKNWSEIFLDEIGSQGIPIYADTSSGYFESIEIRTIMSLLKVIDNPMQDVPLLSLLKSPIMNFTAEELADIRLINKDNYLYENIEIIANNNSNDSLGEKCVGLINKLEEWREKSLYTPIDEFIWFLYMDTAYYGYVGAMPNGVLRQANLRILFERARQYEKTSFKGLFNFVNFINKFRKSSGDMGSAKILGENEDVVRIMSIHKSKGLEFPIVFLCGTGKQFNLMDLNKNILYHDDLGIGLDLVDLKKRVSVSTLPKEAIKQRIKLETLSEEMRVLYVAFTRAKEKLIITGSTSDINKWAKKCVNAASLDNNIILPSEVLKGKCYLDWIGMALCKHRDGEVIRDIVEANDIHIVDDLSTWNIKKYKKNNLIVDNKNEAVDKLQENELWIESDNLSVNEEIDRRLSFKYKYEESSKLRSNYSVSDLKRKNYEEDNDLEVKELFPTKNIIKPKFLQKEKGLTSSEKGTAIHFVMQKLRLNKVNNSMEIEEQLKFLLENDLLSEEEYKIIDKNKIMKFFNSNLGKRLINAFKLENDIYREFPFYTEINPVEVDNTLSKEIQDDKVRIQGVIDCFFVEEGEIVLLDYKTDYVKSNDALEIINKYKIQLKYYKDALEKITNKTVKECYLYLFNIDKEILVEI
ncbi:MAG: helicase-exonuclease AddAB subunit AddA [Clostridiales bacterium]|nr:helicase-exonuclease AddAB subunit AddA [Clostridiales bacterium]